MRASRLLSIVLAAVVVGWLGTAALALAAGKPKVANDHFWTAPDLAQYRVKAIAFLPPTTFDGNVESRLLVEQAVGQALQGSGHRWASPRMVRTWLLKIGGDSISKALDAKIRKNPRLDSLDAPFMSRQLGTRAIFTVRVDQMERRELEFDQTGHPATTVQLKAALVDSTGRLLWTASTNETVEGLLQEADGNVLGVKASAGGNMPIGNTTTAPAYAEVLTKICHRWADGFPKRAAADTSQAGK